MKTTSTSFFRVCMGLSALVLSASLLMFSVKGAKADQSNFPNLPNPGPASGKYGVQYVTGIDGEGNFYWHMMFYNSETGKAKAYYWSRSDQKWIENFGSMPEHGL